MINHRTCLGLGLLSLLICLPNVHLVTHGHGRAELGDSLSEQNYSSGQSSSQETDSDSVVYDITPSRLVNPTYEDEALREILCPAAGTGISFLRYDLRAGRCAEMDTQGHCGVNMIFKEELDSSSYGYCECDFESHSVPLVFHLPTNSCYPVYKQGYCKPGEWLVFSQKSKGPICEKNSCAQTTNKPKGPGRRSKLIFPDAWENSFDKDVRKSQDLNFYENLVPLNGSGPCVPFGAHTQYCDSNEKVLIPADDIFPRCSVPGKSVRRLSIVPNACPFGSYYSIIGYCQPVWDF